MKLHDFKIMKNTTLFCLIVFLFNSCSTDDSTSNNQINSAVDYFPNEIGNIWNYNVENISQSNPELNTNTVDVVSIESSNESSFSLDVNNGEIANGTTNSIFSNGTFLVNTETLIFNGDLSLLSGLEIFQDFEIAFTDFVVYDINAALNTELYFSEDTIEQEVDLGEQVIPFLLEYNLSNTHITYLNSLNVNEFEYNDIIQTEIKLNLSVSAVFDLGIPITQSILNTQDVLVINNYYAKDVGLIKSVAIQEFTLNPTFITLLNTLGIDIDFPTSLEVENTQNLDSYF